MFIRFKVISIGALAAFVGCVLSQLTATCAAAELSEIAAAYAKQEESLESLFVRYTVRSELAGTPADIHKFLKVEWLGEISLAYAFKGSMRYASSRNPGNIEHIVNVDADGNPVTMRVYQGNEWTFNGEAAFVHDGKESFSQNPVGSIEAADQITQTDAIRFNQQYLQHNLRAMPDVFGVEDRCDESLRCLVESGKCQILPGDAIVSETECVVLTWEGSVVWTFGDGSARNELMLNKLYCDPERNYAILRHERFNILNKPVLRERKISSDFVEVTNGVWLPQLVIVERCPPPQDAPASLHGVPLLRTLYEVSEIHANDVPDELFTPEINPGTTISDSRFFKDGEPVVYVIPDDPNQLETVIQAALTSSDKRPNPRARPEAEVIPTTIPDRGLFSSNTGRLFLLINVLLLVGAVVWFIKRRA